MKQVTIIIIAGGSASGKTTVAKAIANDILKDESVTHISMDSYYKDFSDMDIEKRKQINYDHPSSLDVELICKHLDDLKQRIPVEVPIYDFKEHNQSGKTETVIPADVIILDGILALHIEEIRKRGDLKFFIKTDNDIRFIRRLMRDVKERGRELDDVVNQYLNTVKPMHRFFVSPSVDYADLIIPYYDGNHIAVDLIATKIKTLLGK